MNRKEVEAMINKVLPFKGECTHENFRIGHYRYGARLAIQEMAKKYEAELAMYKSMMKPQGDCACPECGAESAGAKAYAVPCITCQFSGGMNG